MSRRSRDGRRQPWHGPLTLLIGLILALLLAAPPAAAFTLPRWGGAPRGGQAPQGSGADTMQEVAPPPAVQQLRAELAERRPRLAIAAPADGAVLPEGPWTLRLDLEDWPLVDAGDLGLGPHLGVQLDDGPARAVTAREVTMPPLTPGSHRLTVFAAWPWGEAVKDPGAWRQIRLHRVTANPLALPAAGSPQLLLVSPVEPTAAEPVLLDWLLLDAPLQNLRDGDDRWRLRVTLNGDSFLVDRQEPLWLRGWRRGSNALLLELVDPRGTPLNPPFNSLVREVNLAPAAEAPPSPWRGARLDDEQVARLLGRIPPSPPAPPAPPPEPSPREIGAEPIEPVESKAPPSSEREHEEDQAEGAGPEPNGPQALANEQQTPQQEPAEAGPIEPERTDTEPVEAQAAAEPGREPEPPEEEAAEDTEAGQEEETDPEPEVAAPPPAEAAPPLQEPAA